MTTELQESLAREMADALKLEDATRRAEAVQTVTLHYLAALCDCQRKTAERVKAICEERKEERDRLHGAVILWRVLRYAVASGAGAIIFKLLQGGA